MLLRKYSKLITKGKVSLLNSISFSFSGGPAKPYDWRDDPKCNPHFKLKASHIGHQNMSNDTPHISTPKKLLIITSGGVDKTNPYINFKPHKVYSEPVFPLPPLEFDMDENIAHEMDYGSEDMDFQPEDFKTQHFHRQGWITTWVLFGIMPFLYFIWELLYQHYPDHLHFRKPHPYYYGHPHEDRIDLDDYFLNNPRARQNLIDSGLFRHPEYEIVDGEYVFSKFAGVNQPITPI